MLRAFLFAAEENFGTKPITGQPTKRMRHGQRRDCGAR